jgi:hypothetical protein
MKKKRLISYVTEFVKFSAGFAVILALALLSLHVAMAAQ